MSARECFSAGPSAKASVATRQNTAVAAISGVDTWPSSVIVIGSSVLTALISRSIAA